MKITNFSEDNGVVYLSFAHDRPEDTEDPLARRGTVCEILDATGEVISGGESFCSLKDNFSRYIGRKISLGRALRHANLSKNERELAWQQYFEITNRQDIVKSIEQRLAQNVQV